MNLRTLVAVATAAILVLSSPNARARTDSPLDTSAIYALLDVIDAIMAAHPDYEAEAERINGLEGEARAAALAETRAVNAGTEAITAAIDALFDTTAYTLYFNRFRNATPETHRDILLALPYQAARGPADVSANLMELCRHREVVRAWVDGTVARVDPAVCVGIAAEWLPPGDYRPVPVRFIYDGNGDAFNTFGGIVFDLFSVVLRFRPPVRRFENLDGVGVDRIEKVIAHEYHHAFAYPLHLPPALTPVQKREQQLATGMVREGTALLCDLGPGLRREVMEDSATVQWWIDAVNEKLAATSDGTLSDDDWDGWFDSTYGELAMERLREYIGRDEPEVMAAALAGKQGASRPMLIYTLGWYMINRILAAPDGKERVLALLQSPQRVFAEYNATLGDGDRRRIATIVE
jgi:hypothetical protein